MLSARFQVEKYRLQDWGFFLSSVKQDAGHFPFVMCTKQCHMLTADRSTQIQAGLQSPPPHLLNEDTHLENLSLNYLSFGRVNTVKNTTSWLKALSNLKHR